MKLGERLLAIKNKVPNGARVADIGTDHAYLPIALIQEGIISYAVASDVGKGPYNAAQQAILNHNLLDEIDLRLGNGLAVLSEGEVDTITIAGMGGATIVDILSSFPRITASLKTLILQPMIAAAHVRYWLVNNNFNIVDEDLVIEDNILYEIIVAESGESPVYEPIMYEIGPVLWKKRHPLLNKHLGELITRLQRTITEMSHSPQAKVSIKYKELEQKLFELEAKQKCL